MSATDASDEIISLLNESKTEPLVQQTQVHNLIICAKDYINSNKLLCIFMGIHTYDSGIDEFWMVYRKKSVRFSLFEYCLITGLN